MDIRDSAVAVGEPAHVSHCRLSFPVCPLQWLRSMSPFSFPLKEEQTVLTTGQQRALDLDERDCTQRMRASRMREMPAWQLFWREDPPFADPFLRDLVACGPVQRLRNIGFLGAIDYMVRGNGRAPHRKRHNRFDHSVNVALLAMRYAALRGLGDAQTRELAATALLHDVGHGPLSHTLEPSFHQLFGIDHHHASVAIVRGASPLGRAIPDIFSRHGVDLDAVLQRLRGGYSGPHAFLFDSPMNIDTIEAIARCCLFSGTPQAVAPAEFVDEIATRDAFPVELGDRFWAIKGLIYKTVILSSRGLAADTIAQQYMTQKAARFRAADFYLDDAQLRRKHPLLFVLLSRMRGRSHCAESVAFAVNFDSEVEAPTRRFVVNRDALVSSPRDLAARYTQEKRNRKLRLSSLVGSGLRRRQLAGEGELELQ